uniref:Ig-like domain-containing protein n=1 Tax=Poecilia reticulata TaxID=8081 RepID=A0A3P9PZT7_POERE
MLVFSYFVEILFCILAAQTETQPTFLTVRGGNDVTLPCGNRRDTHDESDGTIWLFNHKHTSETKTLVKLGNSHREMKTISDRLSVTANGSLLLRNVTEDDGGRYICQWTKSGQPDHFVVFLYVIKSEYLHHFDTSTHTFAFLPISEHCSDLHSFKSLHLMLTISVTCSFLISPLNTSKPKNEDLLLYNQDLVLMKPIGCQKIIEHNKKYSK